MSPRSISSAGDWQSSEKLTRLCTIPEPRCFRERGTGRPDATEAGFCDRYSGLGSSNIVAKRYRATDSASSTSKFSEARLYDFIHKQQGVRFGPFRLDQEQRPPRGLCARKELKLALLSLLELEQAQPSAADSP